jgi:hypothetical protein
VGDEVALRFGGEVGAGHMARYRKTPAKVAFSRRVRSSTDEVINAIEGYNAHQN